MDMETLERIRNGKYRVVLESENEVDGSDGCCKMKAFVLHDIGLCRNHVELKGNVVDGPWEFDDSPVQATISITALCHLMYLVKKYPTNGRWTLRWPQNNAVISSSSPYNALTLVPNPWLGIREKKEKDSMKVADGRQGESCEQENT